MMRQHGWVYIIAHCAIAVGVVFALVHWFWLLPWINTVAWPVREYQQLLRGGTHDGEYRWARQGWALQVHLEAWLPVAAGWAAWAIV
jgi:hypothetical protein